MKSNSKPKVAIIGAGLAGLSAAYHLRNKADVTIFEREDRIGGRVLTSKQPPSEHGAEFLLGSEKELQHLIHKLEIGLTPCNKEWPGCFFNNKFAQGKPEQVVEALLPPKSACRATKLFQLVQRESWPKTKKRFDQWLLSFLEADQAATRFVRMLLAGETCAPLHHLSTEDGLDCLWSMLKDEWYQVDGGSEKLVASLARQSRASLRLRTNVNGVDAVRGGVQVRWTQGGKHESENFHAAIIATPDGERLVGKSPRGHFHGYVSVLLTYHDQPRVTGDPGFDLANGLYTDGPLNYMQLTTCSKPPYTLRILIPNAGRMLHLRESDVVAFCIQHLQPIITNADKFCVSSVKTWKFGLPCGGSNKCFQKVGSRVYLAGDRFGKWPSMDAAISSGKKVAAAFLNRQCALASTALQAFNSRHFSIGGDL